ncbi:MAG: hypothetical protein KGD63_00565 [Candidatus Lokiarchaeota archaeon]|nr:hypothetical protein [Candidatus Lokiarchaeota archaeon]
MKQISDKIYKKFTTIDDFIEKYHYISLANIRNGISLDFSLGLGNRSCKIIPILQLATPKHANIISNLFKDVYNGSYPYKQMEDKKQIENMIKSENYLWFVFKTKENQYVGCIGIELNFDIKKGYIFGLVIKKQFQGILDTFTIWLLFIYYIWFSYKNIILIWTSEIRTFIKKIQFATSLIGLIPIAFLPNKDIFNNKVESEFLNIIYDKKVFNRYRSKRTINIIKEVVFYFEYSKKKYNLESPKIENPKLNLDKKKILKLKDKITLNQFIGDYEIKKIRISLIDNESYFEFKYNLISNTIEKLDYYVTGLELLILLLRKLKMFIKNNNIRYAECFVSAYNSIYQKIFLKAGFEPKGYIPCFLYNKKKDNFEDTILFIYNRDPIDPYLEKSLIYETKKLYKISQKCSIIEILK